ncbi:MAG TPA: hypothetical protein VLH79_10955 [Chthonomonadales bacterium]|nr:hypothetical protein [Chthonomonadales bacterium]
MLGQPVDWRHYVVAAVALVAIVAVLWRVLVVRQGQVNASSVPAGSHPRYVDPEFADTELAVPNRAQGR